MSTKAPLIPTTALLLVVVSLSFLTIGCSRDTTPPNPQFLGPTDAEMVATSTPTLHVGFDDTGSGVDPASLQMVLNGVEVTARVSRSHTGAMYTHAGPLPEGEQTVTASIADRAGNTQSVTIRFSIDTTPPTLRFLSPGDGAMVETTTPTLEVSFDDDGSGVDIASLQMVLNGVEVTAGVSRTPTGATYTPAGPLLAGDNTATASIADRLGNRQSITVRFTVAVFRAIADCTPTSGRIPFQVTFRSRAAFTGGSIVRYRWDFQNDRTFDTDDAVARDFTFTLQRQGKYVAVLEVTNNLGKTATSTCTIQARGSPPTATANATPSNGPVPLTVAFTCVGADADGSIALYEWDFTGDGVFDFRSPTSGSTPHTYTEEGTFVAVCRATDNDGLTTEARTTTTVIRPGPPGSPSVEATADRTSGYAPMTVAFQGSATGDGTIVLWEWDFDGDGVFDFSSPTSPATTHAYTAGGIFAAALRVTDSTGRQAIDMVEITVSIKATVAVSKHTLRIEPPTATANLVRVMRVRTNVSSSSSGFAPGRAIDGDLNTSWFTAAGDAANRGTTPFYEVIFPLNATVVQINMRGNHRHAKEYHFSRGRIEVFDAAGGVLLAQTVDLPAPDRNVDIDIPDQTGVRRVRFTGLADESSTPGFAELEILGWPTASSDITTTIGGTVPVSIFLKDRSGTVVRRLVTNEVRTAGSYTDTWDGTDEHGTMLPQGVYFVILEYQFAGEARQVDLTHSTGGVRYNPSWDRLPKTFKPFAGDLLTINFTIPPDRGASEVLAFIGLNHPSRKDTRFITLLDRVPFGVGTHTIKWDGLDANGTFAMPPSGDQFLFGIFGFTLSDNAIFLEAAPSISNVTVTPNVFDPSTPDFLTPAHPTATVTYDLDKLADVELTVTNLRTGRVLRRIRQGSVPAGKRHMLGWDGHAEDGLFVDKGNYRLTIRAIDATGNASLVRGALVRVFY
jgi:PKD repeat protein